MNYLSVCSGIEAATVAWHDLGFNPVAFSEIEKFPSEVLAHHYPNVPNLGDMTKYKEWNLDTIRLLVGGTPCQSFSVAGLRKGLDDPRGNLALTYVGILDKFRPKWFVWENVPGVLSSGGGRDFGSFLGAVVKLGYGFAYRVLDAQHFGVAQRRRRVFVVGCLGNWESAAKVLFEPESLSRNTKKSKIKGQEIAATITARFGNSRNNHEELAPTITRKYSELSGQDMKPGLIIPTFMCNGFGGYENGVGTLRASGGDLGGGSETLYVANISSTLTASGAGFNRPGQTSTVHENYVAETIGFNINARPDEMKFLNEQSNTLTTSQNSGIATVYEGHGQDCRYTEMKTISPTVSAAYGIGGGNIPLVKKEMAVRRLTEIECERLQGFPDNYTNIKENCPSGARYKALGNSMAVPVMRWIGKKIKEIDKL
jgi:DNA (cytosine-5)-methyltransferase 1